MDYRKPTVKEKEKLEKSREMMVQGIEGEKDIFSRLMPTMSKAARDEMRAARALRESVPARAREGEAYEYAGYKKGGKVKRYAEGGPTKASEKDYSNYNFPGMAKSITEMYEKKAAEKEKRAAEKAKAKEERSTSRRESMTMDEIKMKKGGKVSSASKRADGIAVKGKTRGKIV